MKLSSFTLIICAATLTPKLLSLDYTERFFTKKLPSLHNPQEQKSFAHKSRRARSLHQFPEEMHLDKILDWKFIKKNEIPQLTKEIQQIEKQIAQTKNVWDFIRDRLEKAKTEKERAAWKAKFAHRDDQLDSLLSEREGLFQKYAQLVREEYPRKP